MDINQLLTQNGCTIKFHQKQLDDNHKHSLWYGGAFISIQTPHGFTICIDAIGDVIGSLLNEEQDTELEWFKDKRNTGYFYNAVSRYIPDDATLIEFEHTGCLALENNNWWEISIECGLKWYDLMWCANSDYWDEAVVEAIEALPELIERFGENGTDL